MYFSTKNILKSNRNHTQKIIIIFDFIAENRLKNNNYLLLIYR